MFSFLRVSLASVSLHSNRSVPRKFSHHLVSSLRVSALSKQFEAMSALCQELCGVFGERLLLILLTTKLVITMVITMTLQWKEMRPIVRRLD